MGVSDRCLDADVGLAFSGESFATLLGVCHATLNALVDTVLFMRFGVDRPIGTDRLCGTYDLAADLGIIFRSTSLSEGYNQHFLTFKAFLKIYDGTFIQNNTET